jgi:hypothetical protein
MLLSDVPEEYYFRRQSNEYIGAPIVYNITTDGIYLPNKIDTLRLNADSTYQITLPVNGNEKLTLFLYGERNLGSIYLLRKTDARYRCFQIQ